MNVIPESTDLLGGYITACRTRKMPLRRLQDLKAKLAIKSTASPRQL